MTAHVKLTEQAEKIVKEVVLHAPLPKASQTVTAFLAEDAVGLLRNGNHQR